MKEFNDADTVGTHSAVSTLSIDTHSGPWAVQPLVLVLVDQAADPQDPDGDQHVQVNLTPAKARKVAIALLKAADKAEEA